MRGEEWLVVRTSKLNAWMEGRDRNSCAKDLRPRPGKETTKSAWAFAHKAVLDPGITLSTACWLTRGIGNALVALDVDGYVRRLSRSTYIEEVTSSAWKNLRIPVSDEVQVAALLVFDSLGNDRVMPKIDVVMIRRSAISEHVEDDPYEHLMPTFDWTHRGLKTEGAGVGESVAEALFTAKKHHVYYVREFTLDELRPTLTMLVESRVLRSKYLEAAKALLA